jgi:hypothetical protein
VFRLIALPLIDSRMATAKALRGSQTPEIRLWRERIYHSVHGSPCASHGAVRDILCGNRRAFCHVLRRADRPSLSDVNAANAETEREKY